MTRAQAFRTALTERAGVDHPIVQTGMGWVSGARLTAATAQAGALGFLASATMELSELERAIDSVQARTDRPFGVNLRADAFDAADRVRLMIDRGIRVASFAQAPSGELITRLREAGVLVISSVGAVRHAVKAEKLGVDMVMVQGGEGGGHTGAVATSVLLPAVLDAVEIPVIAAGGFSDGRGLAAALAYGAVGIGMGTRFLLTQETHVADAVKQRYLDAGSVDTVVSKRIDGVPHRVLRSSFVDALESESRLSGAVQALRRAILFRRMQGRSWPQFMREGLAMKRATGRSMSQMLLAANTPLMLKAGLVDGNPDAGVLAAGQVAGTISDVPSVDDLIDRIIDDAAARVGAAASTLAAPSGR